LAYCDDGDATVNFEDDAQASKDPSPFSSCVLVMVEFFVVAAMEVAEPRGSTEAAPMECVLSLGSSLFI
jgi:hypothetical protein